MTGTLSDEGEPDLEGFTVIVTVDGQEFDSSVPGSGLSIDTEEGTWTLAEGHITALGEGTYDVVVTAYDGNNNQASDETEDELTIDTTEPEVDLDDNPGTNRTSPEITGTVDDPDAEVVLTYGGREYEATNNGDGTWTLNRYTIDNLDEGTHTIPVTATDEAGNIGIGEGQITVNVSAPVVTVDEMTTTNTSPAITGTVQSDDLANVTVFIRVNGTTYETTIDEDNGTWILEEGSVATLATGTYDVAVGAEDQYNNYGVDYTTDELTIAAQAVAFLTSGSKFLRYVDADGTLVVVRVRDRTRTAYLRLTFDSDSAVEVVTKGTRLPNTAILADAGVTLASLTIIGDPLSILITTNGGTIAGTTVGGITGSSETRMLRASGVTLVGPLNMSGVISSLTLGSVQSDITMTGVAARPIQISIAEDVTGANIRITNSSISRFTAGSMSNSSLYCGILYTPDVNSDGVYDLPLLSELRAGFTIGRVQIRGYRGADDPNGLFVNTNIGCENIGMVMLMDPLLVNSFPDLNEDGEPEGEDVDHGLFGITANSIRRVMIRDGRTTYIGPGGNRWIAPEDIGDFTVRLPV